MRTSSDRILYVGRTGDSSSPNASSPFSRIAQHLDFRPNAKGNALAKQLNKREIDPTICSYKMLAIGPIFPEQDTFEMHRPFRDIMATLEKLVADLLIKKGYCVLGTHNRGCEVGAQLVQGIESIIEEKFPSS